MLRFLASIVGATAVLAAVAAPAEEASVATILSGLQRPSGVAVRPVSAGAEIEVFVAEAAAGRIVRVRAGQAGSGAAVITRFSASQHRDAPLSSAGPRGLLFLDNSRLVVTGRDGDGAFVRLYELPEGAAPLSAEKYEQRIGPPSGNDGRSVNVMAFQGLARTQANESVADMLIIAAIGAKGSPGFWKVPIRAGTLGGLEPFAFAETDVEPNALAGVAVGSQGYAVVSSAANAKDQPSDELVFLNPIDGSVALKVTAELPPILGLAYSPQTGRLYAAAFGAGQFEDGGIYRLDDVGEPGKPACEAVRIAPVARPTALAFAPDGVLYISALGDSDAKEAKSGALLMLGGEW